MTTNTTTTTPFRLVIAGGGTGGHLMPGIALAQEFERLVPGCEVRFFISGKQLEKDMLLAHGMPFVECGGFAPNGSMIKKVRAGFALWRAIRRARRAMKSFNPHAVVAVGGYASFCGGRAAKSLKKPLFLLEQNTVAGRVIRHLSKMAERLYAQWPLTTPIKGKAQVEVVGNPIRRNLGKEDQIEARLKLNLHPEKKTLLIMGGSQGAHAINQGALDNLDLFAMHADKLQVIHLTGSADFMHAKRAWMDSGVQSRTFPFSNDMGRLYSAADVVLCRAGATTISELTSLSKAMVLVPLPTAKDNHQYLNARFVAGQGAAHIIDQDLLDDMRTWEGVISNLLLNGDQLSATCEAAGALGKPRAGKVIALQILSRFGIQPPAHLVESERWTRTRSYKRDAA